MSPRPKKRPRPPQPEQMLLGPLGPRRPDGSHVATCPGCKSQFVLPRGQTWAKCVVCGSELRVAAAHHERAQA